ncbi:hypothetical protein SAMN04487891_10210 [Flagellimonas taeanensis]|jgi:hypothetical protein|uniref:Uncharacterized protein n=1 Tax=Flagellimonas taeanensis TaxID=1005926 RepID=A0A1M6RAM4_9FLAO|nr:hypothetical protein [Allomuricauda taeanensis]SFB74583.1 hypothetical protein SAMN04487891_10210 [Allomuricauda taeanensis]SHK29398.1 hypothetical protein SAMN05216293_0685 [Allomuricauda taeanensis]
MKRIPTLFVSTIILCLFGCSSDSDSNNGLANAEPQGLCENATGLTGIYWEFAHSIPAPLTQVPTVNNPGGQFVHSLHPLLGFVYPQGFSAFEITDAQTGTLGVNLVRNDDAVVFRWIPNTQLNGQVSATTIIANEINGIFAHYGFNGTPDVLCRTSANNSFEGIPSQFEARLLRFNGITAQVWVRSTYLAGGTFSAISVTSAPSNEYNAQVMDTFLPINFQLFVGRDGTFVDNDNDGVPANEDPDDNNPNVPNNQG